MYTLYALVMTILLTIPRWHASTPIKLWCFCWAVSWAAHAALSTEYYFSQEASFFVFFGNIAFVTGYVLASAVTREASACASESTINSFSSGEYIRKRACYISLALSLLGVAYAAHEMTGGISAFVKAGVFESMRIGKSSLYDGDDYAIPQGVKLATLLVSVTSILAGSSLSALSSGSKEGIGKTYLAIYLATLLALSAVSGVRSYILTSGLLFLFSYFATRTFTNHGRNVISMKATTYASLAIGAFLLWTLVVQSARLQDAEFQNIAGTLEHLRPWFGGYLPALSVWHDQQLNQIDYGYGVHTFRAILGPLGLVTGEGFSERIGFSWIGNGHSSNAMTIFRVFWADFGTTGGTFACLIWGFLSNLVFRNAMRKGTFWLALQTASSCAIFFSINYWFFAYGTRLTAIIAAAVVFSFSCLRFKRPVNGHHNHG